MRNIVAIFRREIASYFVSPIAYVVVGIFLLASGFFFYNYLRFFIEQSFMAQMQAQRFGMPPEMDVPAMVNRQFLGLVSTIILFMIPMLTMGIYAEERKRGTMELLMTSPLSEFQIVAGKFFAAFTLFLAMLIPTFTYQLFMGMYADPGLPWSVILSGYLGLLLLGASLVAIGAFISSLTESQIIAAVATFFAFLLMWVMDFGASDSATTLGEIIKYLSILRHFEDFSRGVIDTASVVFYVSLTGIALFLTLRTLDSMRWRSA